MTSFPEEMILRIWGFWKRVSWELTLDHGSRQLSLLPLGHRVEFSTVEDVVWIFGSLPTEVLNIVRCAARWCGQHSKNCVSLLVSKNRSQEVNKGVRVWTESACICICLCFACVLHLHMFLNLYITKLYNTNNNHQTDNEQILRNRKNRKIQSKIVRIVYKSLWVIVCVCVCVCVCVSYSCVLMCADV